MECTKKQLRGQESCPTTSVTIRRERTKKESTSSNSYKNTAATTEAAEAADAVVASPVSPDDLQLRIEGEAQ